MKTAIIFGSKGQDGFYLSRLLEQQGYSIVGISKKDNKPDADISDFNAVNDLIKKHQPEYVFHLAADSTTKHGSILNNHPTIVTGTLNILESVLQSAPACRVFIPGSGLQFKNENKPIRETDPFETRDAYSLCRNESVQIARYYRTKGIAVFVGYLFNHDSPMRTERHMSKKIAEAAKRIAAGRHESVEVGDPGAVKEYSFAGDIVKGIWTLVNQDKVSEANISSGEGHSIEEWIQLCFSHIQKDWKKYVVIKKDFVSQYRQLVSDPSVIFSVGWKPEISFSQLAAMMMAP